MSTKRLWDKGEDLNRQMHSFTVGTDPIVDLQLVFPDALGSGAQARMLQSIGVLTKEECSALLSALQEICTLSAENKFIIPPELEDCHTAIENYLVQKAGEAGQKIHTGRSRNDQIILAVRLYLRKQLVELLSGLTRLADTFLARAVEIGHHPMPGYTHSQQAMPSSVGMWLHAFAEACLEIASDGLAVLERINSNPLGASAGFGFPLPLNRELVTQLLGFSRTQRSPIDIQNSRGRYELRFVRWAIDVVSIIEKFACDLLLYSTQVFGFFSLAADFTTGSSIMPQNHNPDVIELLRATAGKVRAAENELMWITSKLPSNYHRDLQYTKEPLVRCVSVLQQALSITELVARNFSPNPEQLSKAMSVELYATYHACRLVASGMSFREAYRLAAQELREGKLNKEELAKDFALIHQSHTKETEQARQELLELERNIALWQKRLDEVERDLWVEP